MKTCEKIQVVKDNQGKKDIETNRKEDNNSLTIGRHRLKRKIVRQLNRKDFTTDQ
jgi:hypothetical protein